MAGRMGSDKVTIKNLIVVDIKEDEGFMALSGPVPGTSRGVLIIRKTGEGKLSELVEEVPQVEIQQVEEAEGGEEEKTSGTEKVEKAEDKEKAGKDVSTEKSESSE
jgi:hypothetical protein